MTSDGACTTCQTLADYVVRLPENKKVFDFLAGIFEYICRKVTDEVICEGVTNEFGVVLIESLLNKVFNPLNFCNLHGFCSDYKKVELSIDDYAQRVLNDKPVPHPRVPTHRSSYKVLHLTDTHVDLLYA